MPVLSNAPVFNKKHALNVDSGSPHCSLCATIDTFLTTSAPSSSFPNSVICSTSSIARHPEEQEVLGYESNKIDYEDNSFKYKSILCIRLHPV